MLASMFNPTPAEQLFNLLMMIGSLVVWFYIIKGVIAVWKKTPDDVKKSTAQSGFSVVKKIFEWLNK